MIVPIALAMVFPIEPPAIVRPALDEAFDKRLKEAGKDIAKLWELVVWCEDTDREKEALRVLKSIVKLSPDHRPAREKLGHVEHEGEWFASEKDLEKHRKKELDARAKELGWVKYKGEWVPPEHVAYLKKGLVQGPNGRWLTKKEVTRLEDGWVQQDLVWVAPDEAAKIEEGLWKCGDDWLPLEEADRYHNRLEQPWVVPTESLTVTANLDRATIERAIEQMESGYRLMTRLWGSAPDRPLEILIARRSEQLTRLVLGGGDHHPPYDSRMLLECLRSTFLDAWIDEEEERWHGAGAAFWDKDAEGGDQYGIHDSRMALGLAFSEALDPSPKAVEKIEKKGFYDGFAEAFWSEKSIPTWWFWGTACYTSRYYPDTVGTGGDPFWTRKWSVENLNRTGGIPFLRGVFDLEVKWNDKDTGRRVNAAGLLVAFVVDGGCEPVQALHADLKEALKAGKDPAKIFARLRKEIEDHEDDLRAFARQ